MKTHSKETKTTKPLRGKKSKAVDKLSIQQQRITQLRAKAYARVGRNAMIARAILKELDRPLRLRESDRAMARRLGVSHGTIGFWRKRIKGQLRPDRIVSRRKFLGLCKTLAGLNVLVMARTIGPEDIRSHVVPAYKAPYRFQFGASTLPEKQPRPRASRVRRPA